MPPRKATAAANPGPVDSPGSPKIDKVETSVVRLPEPINSTDDADIAMSSGQAQAQDDGDAPGPSSTFIPPQESNGGGIGNGMDIDEKPQNAEASGSGSGSAGVPAEPAPPTRAPRPPSPPLPKFRNDDDSEDDEVVAQLPIFLSPALFPHLNLFQYPLRTNSLAAPKYAQDRNKLITTRVKENTGRIEVELPVDEDSNVWRRERAEDLGFVAELDDHDVVGGYGFGGRGTEKDKKKKEKEKKAEKKDKTHWGDKMRLRSEVVPNTTGYYSGIIQDGALHLHPVTRTLQFRPNLSYLDDFDEKNKKGPRRRDDEDGDKKSKPAAMPGAVAGRAVKRAIEDDNDGSGSLKDFREKMWSMAREEDEDPWVPYKWKSGAENDYVMRGLDWLVVPEDKRDRLECSTRPLDYLDKQ